MLGKQRHKGFFLFLLCLALLINEQRNVAFCYLRIEGSDMMTMTYVLEVKTSMKAAKLEFRTSMLWKEAASLLG